MLRSHPRISIPPGESHFFVPILQRANEFGNLEDENGLREVLDAMERLAPRFFAKELLGVEFDSRKLAGEMHQAGVRSVAKVIRHLFDLNAHGEGKARWGDKTPYYSLHIPLLSREFPDAQFIHIVRDGRDCALSMLERRFDLGIYTTYHAADIWKHYVDSAHGNAAALGPSRYLEFRYEDLLEAPEPTMRAICDFLGEEFDISVVDYQKTQNAGATPLLQKPVQRANKEKWRTRMSGRAIALFESVSSETLARHGYPLAAKPHRLSFLRQTLNKIIIRLMRFFNIAIRPHMLKLSRQKKTH